MSEPIERDWKPAKAQIEARVLPRHVINAIPRDCGSCAAALTFLEAYHFDECKIYRTVAYSWKKGDRFKKKYDVPTETWHIIVSIDMNNENKKATLARLPKEGVIIKLNPLRPALHKEYLQDPKHIKAKNASKVKNKNKEKRPYRTPDFYTLHGVRWGTIKKT